MSTRSFICKLTDNGLHGIYCHYDGYPKHVGAILKAHYNDEALADMLINGSQLRKFDLDGSFERFDANGDDSEVFNSVTEVLNNGFDYCYLWTYEGWKCYGRDSGIYPKIIVEYPIPGDLHSIVNSWEIKA